MRKNLDPRDIEHALRTLPLSRAPERLWGDVQAELATPERSAVARLARRPLRSPWLAAAAIVLALVGGAVAGMFSTYGAPSSLTVRPLAGAPTIGDSAVTGSGDLAVGDWLATDSHSRAELRVGRIGTAEVGPDSRVRLDRGGLLDHRLTLARGTLRAAISAPPRLFFVQTPSALATDLGCAYTLEVDSTGASHIHVTLGWVELDGGGARSIIPAGFSAEVPTGERPGTPYPDALSDNGRAALRRLDAGMGDDSDLVIVMSALPGPDALVTRRKEGAVTLWHLLSRVNYGARARVYERLAELSPPPPEVTREGIMRLDRPMLERWRADLSPMWSDEAQTWVSRLGRRVWEWAVR